MDRSTIPNELAFGQGVEANVQDNAYSITQPGSQDGIGGDEDNGAYSFGASEYLGRSRIAGNPQPDPPGGRNLKVGTRLQNSTRFPDGDPIWMS